MTTPTDELVVLLDESGNAVGTAPKTEVHHRRTPLHLGFSCYVFDSRGRFLLTRRATHKATWPGVWTNSICGHPAPGEDIETAVRRRAHAELGLVLDEIALVLPEFRYQAVMHDGTAENEMCPVLMASATASPRPNPDEVDALEWVDWPAFRADVLSGDRDVSPWCVEQVAQLPLVIRDPGADRDALPPALRG